MERNYLFSKLWDMYSLQNPLVQKVYNSFTKLNETVINDHIALRTFNDSKTNIKVLEKPFLNAGYKEINTYYFAEKRLNAKHYEVPNDNTQPRVFISELILEKFSSSLQTTVKRLLNSVNCEIYQNKHLIFMGNIWGKPSYKTYHTLREESEYAAWLYAYGFRANHFTVSINHLKKFNSIEAVNKYLKSNGFKLNTSGGEIKGNKEDYLQQSSTLADEINIDFIEGQYKIPGCYYEFAIRYYDNNKHLFSGFIAKNANKIFESTNYQQ